MKKYFLLFIMSVMLTKCGEFFPATLTITNNCTEEITVSISYSSTDMEGETNSHMDSLDLDPGETDSVEIYSAGDTYVTAWAFSSTGSNMFSYYGTDNEIIMTDADF